MYNLGAGEASASAEKRAVEGIYTEAAQTACQLFSGDVEYEGMNNIAYLNQHPNEVVEVDPALYEAFELLNRSGVRLQYLGPAYEIYNGIFRCVEDYQTVDYDPYQNADLRRYFSQTAAFAADPGAVEMELLGENKVRLKVSQAYMQFAQENEIACFVDLYWMKNAFIADYTAQRLADGGYTRGVLSSYDGFVRNLDVSADAGFEMYLFDRKDAAVYPAAVMQYRGPRSIVYLKSYPAANQDMLHYYKMENGDFRVPYLNLETGLPGTSVGSLASYSASAGCAEVLLRVVPAFVGEEFSEEEILALAKDGIDSVWTEDGVLRYTESGLALNEVHPDETVLSAAE